MRIGLITNMMDTNTGGIGRYTEEVVKNLLKLIEYLLILLNFFIDYRNIVISNFVIFVN